MVNRLVALLGLAIVLAAIGAAMLAGAASAAADTGDGGGTKASAESDGGEQKPTEKTDPAPTTKDSNGAEAIDSEDPPAADDTTHPARKTNKKTRAENRKLGRPNPTVSAATTGATPVSKGKSETTATQSEAQAKSESAVSVAAAAAPVESVAPARSALTTTTAMTTAVSASSTMAVAEQVSAPRAPSVINFVGSIVLNVVMGLIHTFDGAPVLPVGSNVTVKTSTLTIPVAGGRTVEADWYFPDDSEKPTRLIYFQHGLGASGPMYSYTDADGAWLGGTPMQQAVADLFEGDRAALTESTSAAAGYEVTLPLGSCWPATRSAAVWWWAPRATW